MTYVRIGHAQYEALAEFYDYGSPVSVRFDEPEDEYSGEAIEELVVKYFNEDNLLELRVVTPEGDILTLDEYRNRKD